jgi:predicted Ser/Thr protein kinase
MTANHTCPECQSPLPADAPAGLCPRCLLQRGMGSDTSGTTASYSDFTPPAVAELAALFPQLEILELIGVGGMGAVYKARQPGLDRLVALKILPMRDDPAFAERFTREARTLAKLNHPGIVTVYDFGQTGGLYYFVMEFVDGVNLRQAERANQLKPAEALAIVPQICTALQFAHDAGIVHRDIKPENILLDKHGRVKIADFGLAKLLTTTPGPQPLTHTHQVMGTIHYMAPEQWEKPSAVDHRADIYSLGVVFYELLTGELPLGRFPLPSEKVQLDVRLDDIVLRTLEKQPERRYQHASDVKTDVEKVAGGTSNSPTAAGRHTTLLLDETDRVRYRSARRLQLASLLCLFGGFCVFEAGYGLFNDILFPSLQWLGGIFAGFGVVLIFIAAKQKLRWEVSYKGHRIAFQWGIFCGDQLFIDGMHVANGHDHSAKSYIHYGEGIGDLITATTTESEARKRNYRLRLFAEPAIRPVAAEVPLPTPVSLPDQHVARQPWTPGSVIALLVIIASIVMWPFGIVAVPTVWLIARRRKQSMIKVVENTIYSLGLYNPATWMMLVCLAGVANAFWPWVVVENDFGMKVMFFGFMPSANYPENGWPISFMACFFALGLWTFIVARLPRLRMWRSLVVLAGGVVLVVLTAVFLENTYGIQMWNVNMAKPFGSNITQGFKLTVWFGPWVALGLAVTLVILGAFDLRGYLINRPIHAEAIPGAAQPVQKGAMSAPIAQLSFFLHVALPLILVMAVCGGATVALAKLMPETEYANIAAGVGCFALWFGLPILIWRWLAKRGTASFPKRAAITAISFLLMWGLMFGFEMLGKDLVRGLKVSAMQSQLVGQWTWLSDRSGTTEFCADGTFEEVPHDGQDVKGQFRWSSPPWMDLRSPGQPERRVKIVFNGDELTVLGNDGSVQRMKRIQPNAPKSPAGPGSSKFLGLWKPDDKDSQLMLLFAFCSDGTYYSLILIPGKTGSLPVLVQGQYRWLDADRMELTSKDLPTSIIAVRNSGDDRLTLIEADGTILRWKRTPPPVLIGEWADKDGNRFALHEDGTFDETTRVRVQNLNPGETPDPDPAKVRWVIRDESVTGQCRVLEYPRLELKVAGRPTRIIQAILLKDTIRGDEEESMTILDENGAVRRLIRVKAKTPPDKSN